ncbi:MAG: pantetheine-phosphate adenylyltransferase [Thermoplasmatales archaeon]
MKVLLGGTFSILHKAHKEMITRATSMGELIIGLTSDNFKFHKRYVVPPYETRKTNLENYLNEINSSARIVKLDDPYGSTLSPEYDAIVSSNETLDFINTINFSRKSSGIAPLIVENVGEILADDLMPIKSERIIRGYIDENGARKKPIKIILVTKNPTKIEGAKASLSLMFKDFELESMEPTNNFHPQPMNHETFVGARRRVEGVKEDYDYAIGIEAGIVSFNGLDYDVHIAAVKDSLGVTNYGMSSGLPMSASMIGEIKSGKELEEVTNELIGVSDSGDYRGAIYYFSRGIKERKHLVEESIISAFTQRIAEAIPRKVK